MAFSSTISNLTGRIQGALCQVNCFCPNLWKQYTDNFQNGTWKYGECLRLGEIDAMWTAAKYSCHNLHHGGFLASEFSHQKHNFNSFMIKDDTTTSKPYMYHIGLSYDQQKGDYYWEQPVGMLPIQLGNDTQHEWSLGYPQVIGRSWCVLSAQTGTTFKLGWQNEDCFSVSKRYLCQIKSCDTDNYCSNI